MEYGTICAWYYASNMQCRQFICSYIGIWEIYKITHLKLELFLYAIMKRKIIEEFQPSDTEGVKNLLKDLKRGCIKNCATMAVSLCWN